MTATQLEELMGMIGAKLQKQDVIRQSITPSERLALTLRFVWFDPNCPNYAGSSFCNYKHAHSIVFMTICDANYVIRFVDIEAYGRRSDGGIFKDSAIGKAFDEGQMNIPQPATIGEIKPILPYCLVGDEAFPLKPYLLRPYPGRRGLTPEQDVYNYRLSRARRVIENTFGILASQWRIYRKPIIASPENAKLMVQATVCLHNWSTSH
ncbi:nuclease harbi1 [Lasius niger]|uniref:Nuclease harbi1 n=1 Tax=Lasius niger TaxID=67767 RepID=A0A0J7KJZ8_LASNI|nr:nuclease harbi1 [Lasius niger]